MGGFNEEKASRGFWFVDRKKKKKNFTMKERDFTIFRRKRTLLEEYLPVHHFGFW